MNRSELSGPVDAADARPAPGASISVEWVFSSMGIRLAHPAGRLLFPLKETMTGADELFIRSPSDKTDLSGSDH